MMPRFTTWLSTALLLVATLMAAPLRAQDAPDALLESGASHYLKGEYQEAIEAYSALVQAGYGTGEVYYNLGNAYHRAGELGEAILAYRRALRRLPRDADVKANLAFLQGKVSDRLTPTDEDPGLKELIFWYGPLTVGELTVLALILNALGFAGLLLWRRRPTGEGIPLWVYVTLSLTLTFGATAVVKAWDEAQTPGAVILYPEVTARSGTDVKGVALFFLHEGAEVEALGAPVKGWVQLRLPDGRRGWVESRFVGLVDDRPIGGAEE